MVIPKFDFIHQNISVLAPKMHVYGYEKFTISHVCKRVSANENLANFAIFYKQRER